jgi:hypothetical protein
MRSTRTSFRRFAERHGINFARGSGKIHPVDPPAALGDPSAQDPVIIHLIAVEQPPGLKTEGLFAKLAFDSFDVVEALQQ